VGRPAGYRLGLARRAGLRLGSSALALASGVLVSLAGAASPAHAAGTQDSVLINTERVDFVTVFDLSTHEPVTGGMLFWQPTARTYTPRLIGLLSMNDAVGFCGKLTIQAYTASGDLVDPPRSTPELCPGGPHKVVAVDINLPTRAKSRIAKVRISASLRFAPGPYAELTSVTKYS
jgi:hypothetical protein